ESGRGSGVELARQKRLEALRVALERDHLESILRALAGREVGSRGHEPHLLLGREAVAEADERRLRGARGTVRHRRERDASEHDENEPATGRWHHERLLASFLIRSHT